jgi:aminoglycoside 3-N-acetyltransferase
MERNKTTMKSKFNHLMTPAKLEKVFKEIGIKSGMSVMVHASLKNMGYLVNGPYDVIDTLIRSVGPKGTLLVPTHTGQLTDPSDWTNPPCPIGWLDDIKANMAPFDPKKTPTRNRGLLPEFFLRYKGVHRSHHPLNSTAALGYKAKYFTSDHPFHEPEGKGSPCYKLYNSGGHILLLGVGLAACTALHTAEYLADCDYLQDSNLKVLTKRYNNKNIFEKINRYPESSKGFDKLHQKLEASNVLKEWSIGDYTIIFFPLVAAVDLALEQLRADPGYFKKP